MPDTTNAVRTTISLPADLKARMDAVQARVNWSAVAADAFREKVLDHESRREVGAMSDVVERLRASREKGLAEEQQVGHAAGRASAEQCADWIELERLASYQWEQNDYGYEIGVYFNGMNGD